MGKPRKNIIGRGEVTPTQVAFIVDRYLCDNRFFKARTVFRSEASHLIPKSSYRQGPSCLMTLDYMLNDYVALKQQKRNLEEERVRLDQEKFRVENMLHELQNVVDTYNSSFITPPLAPAPAYQENNYSGPSSGFVQHNTPNVMSMPGNKGVDSENVSTPLTFQSVPGKRKVSEEATPVTRKPRIAIPQENSSTVNDLVPTYPSGSDPEIDKLLDMDFTNMEIFDEISEIFNFDVDSPMETGSLSLPESSNGKPEPDQIISEHTSTVTETTQGKDKSTQGVCSFAGADAETAANSLTKGI